MMISTDDRQGWDKGTLAITLAVILAGFAPSAAYRKAFDVKKMSPKFVREEARRLLMHPKITQSITQAVHGGRAVPSITPTTFLQNVTFLNTSNGAKPNSWRRRR